MNSRDLSIILVNWNSLAYLRECLRSIYSTAAKVNFEVIVIDNASNSDEAEAVRAEFPAVVAIRSGRNLGFAGANNLGFEYSSGNYLLFLNPDTRVLGDAIGTMLNVLKSAPEAGIVGCKLLNADGTVQTSCIQRFPTILNQILDIESLRLRWPSHRLWDIGILFGRDTSPTPVEMVSGACLMIDRTSFAESGMFALDYFMYAEDVDLCYQVHRRGKQIYYTGDACVMHYGGGSTRVRDESGWVAVMQRQAILRFCEKTRGTAYAIAYRIAMGLTAILRLVFIAALGLFRNDRPERSRPRKWLAVARWAIGLYPKQRGVSA